VLDVLAQLLSQGAAARYQVAIAGPAVGHQRHPGGQGAKAARIFWREIVDLVGTFAKIGGGRLEDLPLEREMAREGTGAAGPGVGS